MAAQLASVVRENGETVCERCVVADSTVSRMRGLLGRNGLSGEEGMLLRPAGSVHTFFMRFPIDVVFLDRDLHVLRVVADVAPWRTVIQRRARAVLELRAGEAAERGLAAGAALTLRSL